MGDRRHGLGQRAEHAAARWLASSGWTILERGWRGGGGELDIIGRDPGGSLVAVEVKCRSSPRAGAALEAIDRRRLGRLRQALGSYAASRGSSGKGLRVDLLTVTPLPDRCWRVARYEGIDGW